MESPNEQKKDEAFRDFILNDPKIIRSVEIRKVEEMAANRSSDIRIKKASEEASKFMRSRPAKYR